MTRRERKLLARTAMVGIALTLSVVAIERIGMLNALERWLYDRRARDCQFFMAPPTDKLVHLDIDDAALETIDRWPWPRSAIASIIDELNRADAKAVALDMILSDAQDPDVTEMADGSYIRIDHDLVMAAAVKKFDGVLVPIAFEESGEPSDLYKAMRAELFNYLETKHENGAMDLLLAKRGFETNLQGGVDTDLFLRARTEAMYMRVDAELNENPDISLATMRRKLLPSTPSNTIDARTRLLAKQYNRALAAHALRRLVPLAPDKTPDGPHIVDLGQSFPPVAALAEATTATGYVYYDPDTDGAVRSIPLWVNHQGYLYPQLGLALACKYLGVDIKDVTTTRQQVTIPAPGGDVVLPVWKRPYQKLGDSFDLTMTLPWFGRVNEWSTMYDPQHRQKRGHLPINMVWRIVETLQRIRSNNEQADDAIKFVFASFDQARLKEYEANPRDLGSPLARQTLIRKLLAIQTPEEKKAKEPLDSTGDFFTQTVDAYRQMNADGEDIGDDGKRMIANWDALKAIYDYNPSLAEQLATSRSELNQSVGDKAVLIGWTATGALADFVPTSIHARCPGVVVHGVVFNAILTGETWTQTGAGVTSAVTLMVGLIIVALMVSLSPERATMAVFGLVAVGFVINGIVLFDWQNIVVNAAGPLTAAAVVWGGCLLFRFIVERAERARIERRFRSYVDPALVDYVQEHPEKARLEGEMRNLSVVFTDLQGFTTLSEMLREKTVGILNEYMELMVPVIRENDGYVNKFLGDGMMFFYGAPQESGYHAREAVLTCLKMQELMVPFNKNLTERNLPNVHMRIGIASGPMVVGDAGPSSASDYTVLGDTVNLSARLESANKYTGTWIMLNQGTADLIGDEFLLRPVGRLQVVGKSEGIMTYVPLCKTAEATDEQRKLVQMSSLMFESYASSDFEQCIEACKAFEDAFGESKLATLYRKLAEQYNVLPPGKDFGGQIVLESK